jgi:hypothetical protein
LEVHAHSQGSHMHLLAWLVIVGNLGRATRTLILGPRNPRAIGPCVAGLRDVDSARPDFLRETFRYFGRPRRTARQWQGQAGWELSQHSLMVPGPSGPRGDFVPSQIGCLRPPVLPSAQETDMCWTLRSKCPVLWKESWF